MFVLTSEIIERLAWVMGTDSYWEGLNDPTSGRGLGIDVRLAGEIIEPLDTDLDIVYMMEGLNNPTNV